MDESESKNYRAIKIAQELHNKGKTVLEIARIFGTTKAKIEEYLSENLPIEKVEIDGKIYVREGP